jgi:thermostable 8-oxoguanine DNA glycosylase
MNIKWDISENDIQKITDFVNQHKNPFVEARIERNILRRNIHIDKDSVLKCMLMCLLTTQQRSGPDSLITVFMRQNPFPLTYSIISHVEDVEDYVRWVLQKNSLNRYINKIPAFFAINLSYLEDTKWLLLLKIESLLEDQVTKQTERIVADSIDHSFKGFGSKQARNFLQALGLTKYEIPIDSRITNWLNDFAFPVTLSATALQEKAYYHFVSDGIQLLCEKANIYPCVLDAAIFSSFDNGQWTKENAIY